MKRRKGEIPAGLLTTSRIIEAEVPLVRSDLLEQLVRALTQEFAAVSVMGEDPDGSPTICCTVPHGLAPVEVPGPVRISVQGNKAEVIFEARLRARPGLRRLAAAGCVVWPLGLVILRARGMQRECTFEMLEHAMDRLVWHYRAPR